MNIWNEYLSPFVDLFVEMAPYLLLGFLIAGVLHAFVPKAIYRRYLGKNNLGSVIRAILIGVPLPLCSCGVIPTAVGMRKEGASKGATSAFLIATPQTGIDSILATYAVFGLPFALLRPVAAMTTGLFGGIVTNLAAKNDEPDASDKLDDTHTDATVQKTFSQKVYAALDYGFTDMLMDIGKWLVIGIVFAGFITIFVPEGFFLGFRHNTLISMLIVLLIACPMYVCATGSIPIAAALMLKGLSPGAALVFLMAGPATNMASMMVLGKTLGRRSLVAYLVSIVFGAILFGLAIDTLLPAEWFGTVMHHMPGSACCKEEPMAWWEIGSAVLLLVLLLRALWLRYHGHECSCGDDHCGCGDDHCSCGDDHCSCGDDHCGCGDDHCGCKEHHETSAEQVTALKVDGMMCNHCRAHVEEALKAVEGVEHVVVDLGSGTARVVGTAQTETLIAAVEACGYKCTLQ